MQKVICLHTVFRILNNKIKITKNQISLSTVGFLLSFLLMCKPNRIQVVSAVTKFKIWYKKRKEKQLNLNELIFEREIPSSLGSAQFAVVLRVIAQRQLLFCEEIRWKHHLFISWVIIL